MGDAPEYLTTRQAADLLGVSKSRVDQFCREGKLPFVTVGQMRLIRPADIKAFRKKPRRPGRPRKPKDPGPGAPRPPPPWYTAGGGVGIPDAG